MKKIMKYGLLISLIGIMLFTFTACGDSKKDLNANKIFSILEDAGYMPEDILQDTSDDTHKYTGYIYSYNPNSYDNSIQVISIETADGAITIFEEIKADFTEHLTLSPGVVEESKDNEKYSIKVTFENTVSESFDETDASMTTDYYLSVLRKENKIIYTYGLYDEKSTVTDIIEKIIKVL